MRAYKIVEIVDGEIKTLFHGLNGSRTMPRGVWLDANEKMVRDGAGDRYYKSGFHVFMDLASATHYLTKFIARGDRLQVVLCRVEGVRPKEHSPSNVMLAERIKF